MSDNTQNNNEARYDYGSLISEVVAANAGPRTVKMTNIPEQGGVFILNSASLETSEVSNDNGESLMVVGTLLGTNVEDYSSEVNDRVRFYLSGQRRTNYEAATSEGVEGDIALIFAPRVSLKNGREYSPMGVRVVNGGEA